MSRAPGDLGWRKWGKLQGNECRRSSYALRRNRRYRDFIASLGNSGGPIMGSSPDGRGKEEGKQMNAEMIDEELKQACRADDQADPFGAAALALVRAIIRALLNALLARCPDTAHHSLRVARTVVPVAARMGLPQERIRNTRISALLHDTGKIGVEDGVLKKDGPLTPEEYRAIQEHVPIGVRLLEDNGLHRFIPGVQFHHSRPDGKGYPGAILSEIPIEARIIGVLDAVDAMSFPRVYRQEPRPAAEVDEILLKKAGVEWDTEVVGAFLRVRPEIDRLQRPPVE